jgi:superfamily II DNA or RNA helicase
VDLSDVAWTAGRYAPDELAGKLVSAAEIFVDRAVKAVSQHIARPEALKAIAFCANVRHAEEVSRQLAKRGFKTQLLTGETPAAERRQARGDLNLGKIQILCVVDIYNEGVDVPNVNTLFFFRPTESSTVFLQQLGRGLRPPAPQLPLRPTLPAVAWEDSARAPRGLQGRIREASRGLPSPARRGLSRARPRSAEALDPG